MPPSLNEDALSEHDLLELQANAVIELAAADDLASGLASVVTSIRRIIAAPRVELWSPIETDAPAGGVVTTVYVPGARSVNW